MIEHTKSAEEIFSFALFGSIHAPGGGYYNSATVSPPIDKSLVTLYDEGVSVSNRVSFRKSIQGRNMSLFAIHDISSTFFGTVFEETPIPLSVYDRDGLQVASNAATARLWNIRREEWVGHFNMITDPQLAAQGSGELHRRVMNGETIVLPPHPFDGAQAGFQDDALGERWAEATYAPLRDENGNVTHLIAILRDVTNEVIQNRTVAEAQAEIANQQRMIESLSNPVIQIWQGILTVPLIGAIDSRRSAAITESLLHAITRQQADCIIIDITGVPMVDTQIAQHLLQTARACQLLGCKVALVGISVEIAQTLVQLGVDLSTLVTLADLQAGVTWAFAQQQLRVVAMSSAPSPRSTKLLVS